jgi:hypothetical protein
VCASCDKSRRGARSLMYRDSGSLPCAGKREWRNVQMAKEIQCVIGVDIDAVAGWLGSYGGEDSPNKKTDVL